MIDKFAKFGEAIMIAVFGSAFMAIFIWENSNLPNWSILYWGIPAIILATIGFILNGRHINNENARRVAEFEAMQARHRKMLGEE